MKLQVETLPWLEQSLSSNSNMPKDAALLFHPPINTDKQQCEGSEEKANTHEPVQRTSHLAGTGAQGVG